MTDEKQEHGPETACYSHDGVKHRPFIQCLCGWSCNEYSWEDAGVEFDRHLESVGATE